MLYLKTLLIEKESTVSLRRFLTTEHVVQQRLFTENRTLLFNKYTVPKISNTGERIKILVC